MIFSTERTARSRRLLPLVCVLSLLAFGLAPKAVSAQQDLLEKGLEAMEGALGGDGGSGLSEVQIGKGLKQALRVASTAVVDQVGRTGGYLQDQAIRIPLPGYLETTRSVLSTVGAAGLLEDLEVRLNRAAEAAAPEAQSLFLNAIEEMTLGDAREILAGPDDAATHYFKRTMSPDLKSAFRPIIQRELSQAGAIDAFDQAMQQYESIPFASSLGDNAQARLTDHALDGALTGIFHYLAQEEAAIRNNPTKRTTDLLKQVFG